MLWVKDVRGGRVVDDDCVLEISANLRQVLQKLVDATKTHWVKTYLYVVSLVVVTAFAEESVMHNTMNVELVEQRITILHLLALNVDETAMRVPWRRMQ
jgi:ferritin-like protein